MYIAYCTPNVANQPTDTAECSVAKRRGIGSAEFALILIEPSPQLHPNLGKLEGNQTNNRRKLNELLQ